MSFGIPKTILQDTMKEKEILIDAVKEFSQHNKGSKRSLASFVLDYFGFL